MKAWVSSKGDASVGLNGNGTELDLCFEFDGQQHRESTRSLLADCFGEMWGEKVYVQFGDENNDA